MPPLHQHTSSTSGTPADPTPASRAGRRTRRTGAVAIVALAALAVGGCGGSSSSPSAGPTSPPSATFGGNPPMATVVTIDKVAGNLHKPYHRRFHAHAKHLTREVGQAVDAWFDGGFVGVDYPTHSYPGAFTSFTAQARQDAFQQKGLMTAGPLGAHIDGVTTLQRKVSLDVLAPKGRPSGVTARVVLRFKTTGHATKKVTVTGRLFLTQSAGGAWRIFGFDVAKGAK